MNTPSFPRNAVWLVLLVIVIIIPTNSAQQAESSASSSSTDGTEVGGPNDPFCAGTASLSNTELYEEPSCLQSTGHMAAATDLPYMAREIRNLSFCCNANYTALIPIGADLDLIDQEARWFYDNAVMAMTEYDCANFYPFRTCQLCLDAYRTWTCSLFFPMKCRMAGSTFASLKVCEDVCYEVQRKCPIELNFTCPVCGDGNVHDEVYGRWSEISAATAFGKGGCNPMQYHVVAGSKHARSDAAALAVLSAAVVAVVLMI